MLIDAKKQAIYDKVKFIELSDVSSDIKAPKIIMPEIAFETLIKGECKAGVTPHIMKYPTKQDNIKMVVSVQISIAYPFDMHVSLIIGSVKSSLKDDLSVE